MVQMDILRGLLGLDCATAMCPHRRQSNVFPGFDSMKAYTCHGCGRGVDVGGG
jgi:hypothetical protein